MKEFSALQRPLSLKCWCQIIYLKKKDYKCFSIDWWNKSQWEATESNNWSCTTKLQGNKIYLGKNFFISIHSCSFIILGKGREISKREEPLVREIKPNITNQNYFLRYNEIKLKSLSLTDIQLHVDIYHAYASLSQGFKNRVLS